jgi:hypothetical protein
MISIMYINTNSCHILIIYNDLSLMFVYSILFYTYYILIIVHTWTHTHYPYHIQPVQLIHTLIIYI